MTIINEIMCCKYLITVIIVILLPLIPNKKLRYYTCYCCFAITFTLMCIMLLPTAIIRPRSLANMRFGAKVISYYNKILGIEWIIKRGDILGMDREAMVVLNHQSYLDTMGVSSFWEMLGKWTVISKKEVMYYFPFGPMLWLGGLVFIDRMNPKSAIKKMESTFRHLRENKAKLLIFPEGTRNMQRHKLLPFKKGAFVVAICTQVPIIPIVFSPYHIIDSVNKTFSKGKMIVSVLEPISTEGLTLDDVESLRDKTHKLMSDEYVKLQKEVQNIQQADLH